MDLLNELKSMIENDLTKQALKNKVKKILEKDKYKYSSSVEPFENFIGKLCYDYSGYVEKDNTIVIDYNDMIENVFDEIYTGESRASYTSNCGLFYDTFLYALRNEWENIKNEKVDIFLQNNKEEMIKNYKVEVWEDEPPPVK